jgi:hypothetical protein
MGVHPEDDDLQTADRMWPIIKGVLEHLDFDGRDYLVEGVASDRSAADDHREDGSAQGCRRAQLQLAAVGAGDLAGEA